MAAQNAVIKFDLTEIPDSSRFVLLSIVHEAASDYFKQPGVAEKFEKWKAEKEKTRERSKT